jgi:hypothetical protein
MLEATWLHMAVQKGEYLEIPRIAIIVSPGFFDNWVIRWELYHATFRGENRRAIITCIGSGGHDVVYKFCKERTLVFHSEPEIPTMDGIRLRIKPDLLIALDKEEGVIWEYAKEVHEELGIPVIRRQVLQVL